MPKFKENKKQKQEWFCWEIALEKIDNQLKKQNKNK